MSTTVLAPEIAEFLAVVRAQLADLDPEEQSEITDGLVADLTDLVSERGPEALGDPVAYARELRQAAGLEETGRPRRDRRPVGELVHGVLDAAAARWKRVVEAAPGDLDGLLVTLRPAWWVLRAWVAVAVAGQVMGGSWPPQVVPWGVRGVIVLGVAVVLSVQLGRGKLWPGERWRAAAGLRVLLLALNVFAIVMVPVQIGEVSNGWRWAGYDRGYNDGYAESGAEAPKSDAKAGLYAGGKWITNVYAYDAAGQPITGVQLFDQDGKPIDVVAQPQCVGQNGQVEILPAGEEGNPCDAFPDLSDMPSTRTRVFYPWTNGVTRLLNVFPVPSALQDAANQSVTAKPEIGDFPLASVPPLTPPPGVVPSVIQQPKAAEKPAG